VLLPEVDEQLALTVADRVRKAVSGETGDSDDSLIQIPIRLSMGVAEIEPGGDLSSLTRAADAALYRAKHAGRNVVSN
jgi:diguanylate cyclase (GGDEF)-like protein